MHLTYEERHAMQDRRIADMAKAKVLTPSPETESTTSVQNDSKTVVEKIEESTSGQGVISPPDRKLSRAEYIQYFKDYAIENMVKHKVPASITLAQGIFESGDGNSKLAKTANNHFGIKTYGGWTGPYVIHSDDRPDDRFRKYDSVLDSYMDHALFLKNNRRYAALFELKITDYKGWAIGLKKAGYATNREYHRRIIKLIEENNLMQYDKIGMKRIRALEN
ncbi:hypothetical protein GCM10023331_16260 [Algivirga pacifica]|uniref:Mannosyl-glycoprotein endo-beta-N-acetylglucosamidase-like domain-containing protein n=2 Tax=Algivirga pacifica TaxID=1162670 RepID=A0ABP9DAG4_9BACT